MKTTNVSNLNPSLWIISSLCKPMIKDCFPKKLFQPTVLWIVQKLQCTLNFPSKSYVQYSSDLQLRLHERPRFSGSFHKLRKGFSNEILMYKTSFNVSRWMRFGEWYVRISRYFSAQDMWGQYKKNQILNMKLILFSFLYQRLGDLTQTQKTGINEYR